MVPSVRAGNGFVNLSWRRDHRLGTVGLVKAAFYCSEHVGQCVALNKGAAELGLLHDQVTVSVTRPDWRVWS
jgi:hypothetical protein